ncbi:hypothetical protein BH18THE2_BH18THE2_22200 [soil metagenome]
MIINCNPHDSVDTLKQAEVGSHYLVIYPDIPTFRTIYSNYAKSELEEDSNELVVILLCYETTYGVRKILSEVLDVKKHVREGSLMILDSLKAYPDLGVSISPFAKRLLDRAINSGRSEVSIFGEMGSFYLLNNNIQRLIEYEYELSLPSKLADIRMKGFCFYHEKDFDQRFKQNQKERLVFHHGKSLIAK